MVGNNIHHTINNVIYCRQGSRPGSRCSLNVICQWLLWRCRKNTEDRKDLHLSKYISVCHSQVIYWRPLSYIYDILSDIYCNLYEIINYIRYLSTYGRITSRDLKFFKIQLQRSNLIWTPFISESLNVGYRTWYSKWTLFLAKNWNNQVPIIKVFCKNSKSIYQQFIDRIILDLPKSVVRLWSKRK